MVAGKVVALVGLNAAWVLYDIHRFLSLEGFAELDIGRLCLKWYVFWNRDLCDSKSNGTAV